MAHNAWRPALFVLNFISSFAVKHDVCWLGLAADADVMIEGRVLSEALRSLKVIIGSKV